MVTSLELEQLVPAFGNRQGWHHLCAPDGALFTRKCISLGLITFNEEIQTEPGYDLSALSGDGWEFFEPMNGYWQALEIALANGEQIPPIVVEQNHIGEYEVMDGHHRVSIARYLGIKNLDAYVLAPVDR